ncbi:hypothetical protein HYZ99_00945 [Candidatus Peregrinibacteria bacterium]|nr:hypothetical protein [Candidatus Peregrinibacteria bacterium]
MPTQTFLSIKEASERYGKAEITIRRFVKAVLEKHASSERKQVRPLPDEAVKLKKQKRPFAYTISEGLLREKFGAAAESAEQKKEEMSEAHYLSLLEKTNAGLLEQIKVKDQQIGALNTSLEQLSERQRETNLLMKLLQDKLILPAPQLKRRWWSWGK